MAQERISERELFRQAETFYLKISFSVEKNSCQLSFLSLFHYFLLQLDFENALIVVSA